MISGGVDESYAVPFLSHIPALTKMRQQGIRINLHVGFPSKPLVSAVGKIADVVSLDIPGTDQVMEEVYGIGVRAISVIDLYQQLRQHHIVAHPHITIGLAGGKIDHEYHAIRALEKLSPKILVMNMLIPTPGSAYEKCKAPDLKDVETVFRAAKDTLVHTKLILGCMQPPGRYRVQVQLLALDTGFDGWVQPVGPLIDELAQRKRKTISFDECCAFVHTLMDKEGEGGKSWNS